MPRGRGRKPPPPAKPRLLVRVQNLAERKNITAYRIAQDTDLDVRTVQRMLNREESPMLRTLEVMVDYLEKAPKRR